jgi:ABC-type polysaccharide/polyol phosphate export permease
MFVEPMMFTIGVTCLWTIVGMHKNSAIPITAFALTGYSCVLLWRTMPSLAESAIKMNSPLMHHRNVRAVDIFFGRLLLQAGGATMSFVILGIFFTWIGWIQPPEDPLKVFVGWIMMALFGMSLALFVGSLAHQYHPVAQIWHPLSYILMPLSGAGFLVEIIPNPERQYLLLIPMVHGCECIRDGYFGSLFKADYNLEYMGIFTLVLFILGFIEVEKAGKKVVH